jgi:UDP-N-acetylglucosamine/UDP-N-acetylgalactosamine diphosphorylase
MQEADFLKLCETYNQAHLIKHYNELNLEEKQEFLCGLQGLDFDLTFKLYRKFAQENSLFSQTFDLQPAPVITLPATEAEKAAREEARKLGESLLRKNQVAVLIVAGGQASRLGYNGPKGTFAISPLQHKSLFQLLAEYIRASQLKFGAEIPLLLMTSADNCEVTRQFFITHNFFGLNSDKVQFFNQAMLPAVTPEGKLILKHKTRLFTNPDGHGGSLKALYNSGLVQKLKQEGITQIFYCQVDNPLVKVVDPVFLGYHLKEGSEISSKVLRKRSWDEKVGLWVIKEGKPAVIEYSDLAPEVQALLDTKGELRYWAGSIAIHLIALDFVLRLNEHGFALPYHKAVKSIVGLGADGRPATLTGWKFETFVFDAIPLARKACAVETKREEEFSPIKEPDGPDSPDTAKSAMIRLFKNWLKAAGVEVAPGATVEISPLYALDQEELSARLKGQDLKIDKDLYLE